MEKAMGHMVFVASLDSCVGVLNIVDVRVVWITMFRLFPKIRARAYEPSSKSVQVRLSNTNGTRI